jgi:hypothetical protein
MNALQNFFRHPACYLSGTGQRCHPSDRTAAKGYHSGFQEVGCQYNAVADSFKAFATMVFEVRYLAIVVIFFLSCNAIMIISSKLHFIPVSPPYILPS